MSLLDSKGLLKWTPPRGKAAPRKEERAEIWPPPARSTSQGLSVHVLGCRTGLRLLKSPDWRYVWVEVEVENTSREELELPRGRRVVLVDTVGYAYRDLNPIMGRTRLGCGQRKRVRYLFRASSNITVGKLRLLAADTTPIAETGFVDLTIPCS